MVLIWSHGHLTQKVVDKIPPLLMLEKKKRLFLLNLQPKGDPIDSWIVSTRTLLQVALNFETQEARMFVAISPIPAAPESLAHRVLYLFQALGNISPLSVARLGT